MILAPNDYQDNEYGIPREAFENAGCEVTVASMGVEVAKGVLGGTVEVDGDISSVVIDDYDAVILVGGGGAKVYFDDVTVHQLLKDAYSRGKVVGAICISPSTLANSGLLEGRKATAFPSEGTNLVEHGAQFTGEEVTVDGNIVTASGPRAAGIFAQEILKLLGES